jgi:predicted lipoprotein with Yx(FWY)xxD motif
MALQRGRTRSRLGAQLTKGAVATVALGAGAMGVSTLAFSAPASARGSSSGTSLVIKTEHVANLGTVLATGAGLTLYRYNVDPAGKVSCTGECAKVWPPLLLPKDVKHIEAPHGVKGLTAIRVRGGHLQVFFHDHALYRFVNDTKKGEASGQGVESAWFAVLSDGKSSAAKSTSTSPSSGTGGTTTTAPATPTTPASPTTSSGSGAASTSTTMPPVSKSTPVTSPPPTTTPPTTAPPTTAPPTTTTPPPPTTTTTAPPTGGAGF